MTTPNSSKSPSHRQIRTSIPMAHKAGTARSRALLKQFEDVEFRLLEFVRVLGAEPAIKAVVRNSKRHAATTGRRMQKLAFADGRGSKERCDPRVRDAHSQEDFMFEIRRHVWESLEMVIDSKEMEPPARLRLLRRRLWNAGRSLELLAKVEVFDRAELLRIIHS